MCTLTNVGFGNWYGFEFDTTTYVIEGSRPSSNECYQFCKGHATTEIQIYLAMWNRATECRCYTGFPTTIISTTKEYAFIYSMYVNSFAIVNIF